MFFGYTKWIASLIRWIKQNCEAFCVWGILKQGDYGHNSRYMWFTAVWYYCDSSSYMPQPWVMWPMVTCLNPNGVSATSQFQLKALLFWLCFAEPCSCAIQVTWATYHVSNGGYVIKVPDNTPNLLLSLGLDTKLQLKWYPHDIEFK